MALGAGYYREESNATDSGVSRSKPEFTLFLGVEENFEKESRVFCESL